MLEVPCPLLSCCLVYLQVLTEELKAAVVADAEDEEHARLVIMTSPLAGLTASPDGTHPQLAVGGGWRRAVARFQMEVQVRGSETAVRAARLQQVGQSTSGVPERGAGKGSRGPIPSCSPDVLQKVAQGGGRILKGCVQA